MSYFLKKGISTKSEGIITDIDIKTGVIKGYFAIFGNKDSDNDIIMPGAFTKSLNDNGSRIRHVWQHDITLPLAKPTLSQDSKGLAFESTISQTTWGKNALILYEDGVIDEHSIGYNTIKSQAKKGYNELTELRLWEGSSVTLGANELAIGGMKAKSMTPLDIVEKMERVYKSIRNGKYEGEDMFFFLDEHMQQLKQLLYDKLNGTPAVEETQEPTEEKSMDSDILNKINSLISLF